LPGGPLDGYDNTTVYNREQKDKLKVWIINNLIDDLGQATKPKYSKDVELIYFSTTLIFDVFIQLLALDGSLAIFSMAMVGIYIGVATGSTFLAIVGISEIVLSLPLAWFVLRILRIDYFGPLNIMCIFIVAAIGADDIFVFMDAYVQSAYKGSTVNCDLETRMSWVYRKSGLAMFITSFTTCAAFLCCLGTPIPSVQGFGVFAALVIAADYLLVMTMFCSSVVVYHNRFEKKPLCGCSCPTPLGNYRCGCCTENCDCSNTDPSPTQIAFAASTTGRLDLQRDPVEMFFRDKFAPMILRPRNRIIIGVISVVWLIPAVIFVLRLKPTEKQEQFLKPDHPFQKAITVLDTEFPSSSQDRGIDIMYTWGLKTVDRKHANILLNLTYIGDPQFDTNFKLTHECWVKVRQVCEGFRYNMSNEYTDLIQRTRKGDGSLKCFIYDLEALQAKTPAALDVSTEGNIVKMMPEFWKAQALPEEDDDNARPVTVSSKFSNLLGWDGTAIKFVGIAIESKNLTQWARPPEWATRQVYEAHEKLRDNVDFIAKEACGSSVQMTELSGKFTFMNNQKIYRTSSVTGALIGIAIAFGVLILCTWSLVISVLSTISILCTFMSVIGLMSMMGYTLGTTESILITILAGFAVDYVVHLAHGMSFSKVLYTEALDSM
jgi:predicted RND superfamily exporter protein